MSGQFSMKIIQISHSQLGNSGLGGLRAYLTADQSQGLGFDGLMGVSMLRAAQISFDFERRLFTWQARNSKIPLTMEAKRSPPPLCLQAQGAMSRSLEWGLAAIGGYQSA
jgi:hypothetical protein